ncbi:MAG: hypothetical protein WC408_04390 [Candidatus Micrarchaeia archaeon]
MKQYDKLSPHLREENVSTGRYPDIQAFYSKHQSNARLLACRKSKNDASFRPLPEESDMKILAEVSLFPNSYLIVSDCDFHSLTEEIGDRLFRIYSFTKQHVGCPCCVGLAIVIFSRSSSSEATSSAPAGGCK